MTDNDAATVPHRGIGIRRARADEAAQLRALRLRALADTPEAFSTTFAKADAMPDSYWQQRVTDGAAGIKSIMVVAADQQTDAWLGMMVGFRDETDRALGHVVSVWVAPEARHRGAARRMLAALHDWARDCPLRTLRLGVTDGNLPARRLYERAGYLPTGRQEPLTAHPGLSEIEMECKL